MQFAQSAAEQQNAKNLWIRGAFATAALHLGDTPVRFKKPWARFR